MAVGSVSDKDKISLTNSNLLKQYNKNIAKKKRLIDSGS
jgi:hypothetical protein